MVDHLMTTKLDFSDVLKVHDDMMKYGCIYFIGENNEYCFLKYRVKENASQTVRYTRQVNKRNYLLVTYVGHSGQLNDEQFIVYLRMILLNLAETSDEYDLQS